MGGVRDSRPRDLLDGVEVPLRTGVPRPLRPWQTWSYPMTSPALARGGAQNLQRLGFAASASTRYGRSGRRERRDSVFVATLRRPPGSSLLAYQVPRV